MNSFEMTRVFHEKMLLPVNDAPIEPTAEERILRAKLLLEETLETVVKGLGLAVEASAVPGGVIELRVVDVFASYDPVETLDGLADVKVIANGTAVHFGLPMNAADCEVFESNMSKLDDDGNPIVNRCTIPECIRGRGEECDEANPMIPCPHASHLIDPTQPVGKILKGPNFRPPNIAGLLR